ncbi:MAG: hypothetical protein HN778_06330 [Prolixibacteraceae bacterium]|jgi:hypothetical protein|nr:hypothetical protein [Prolixibacteraceae bacterium]MBT6765434.1 hypothetical protein [Prolixibacteraceae bacterium]MBT6997853.1 hypothetical protein [Prolixibacteraceae bacterium]MBT7394432.1 hypothetical protein [Prolixibacteraceae bacterium]
MTKTITKKDIEQAQQKWGGSLVQIGKTFSGNKDYKKEAEIHVSKFYGYREKTVLFKPTKASKNQFRLTTESAVSYFVGGNPEFSEDHGFALQPWTSVRFENAGFIFSKQFSVAMGNYFFTDADGNETKVEYTFGYYRAEDGTLKINLHHSSLPFKN